jgi:uncharacterized protein (DUF1501 family)
MSRRKQPNHMNSSRREFLWKGACAALTTTGIATTIRDLRLINAATALDLGGSTQDYKALVCIFLFGGNDGNNLFFPTDTTRYNQYVSYRGAAYNGTTYTGGLALSPPGTPDPITGRMATALNVANAPNGQTYAMNPDAPELATLFNGGKLALLANVGTLLGPISKSDYTNASAANHKYIPPQLFSHSDQQLEWQTGLEDQPPKTGWGGRSADLLYTLNGSAKVSMNISLAGANTYETGNTVNTYNVSTNGAVSLSVANSNDLAALQALLNQNHGNLYQSAYGGVMNSAITNASLLNTAIAATVPPPTGTWNWNTAFTTSSLGTQLKMIARLIQAAPNLGHYRQIFFASAGGFDLHTNEGVSGGNQGNLLADLSKNMNALYQATGQVGVQNSVVQFTASDFSRTFPVNGGLGADHGWGNNHLILGGPVSGGNMYGTFPDLTVGGANDTSTGRWIPTTGVEQYSATLANWFGVSDTNMTTVFPYITRWGTLPAPYLGFLPTT